MVELSQTISLDMDGNRNAGYGTKEHQAALASLGVTSAHRKSYAPIRKILGQGGSRLPHMGLEIFPKSLI